MQNDEDDMGMTYEELSVYGRLRKVLRCGPVSMFLRCLDAWHPRSAPRRQLERLRLSLPPAINVGHAVPSRWHPQPELLRAARAG